MPHVEDTLCVAFKYHMEQFVHHLSNWSIQAVNNSPRMAIVHSYPDLCIPETAICKTQREGVKYCAQGVRYLTTTPEPQNDWRVHTARLPSPMSKTFPSFVLSCVRMCVTFKWIGVAPKSFKCAPDSVWGIWHHLPRWATQRRPISALLHGS